MVPNGGMSTLCVVWMCPWTSFTQNSLGTVMLGSAEGVTPFAAPCPLHFVQQLEQPRHSHTKVGLFPGHCCPHQFPFCDYSHHPVNNLGPHTNWYLLGIGHDGYDQHQDILLVALVPQICRLTSTCTKYGMA